MRLCFDIETDGLLDELTQIHSLVLKDVDTGEFWSMTDHPYSRPAGIDYVGPAIQGVRRLAEADEIIGHNIIKFDLPAIQKLYPWFQPECVITDTLTGTRLIWPNIKDSDMGRVRAGKLPGKLMGSHSLEAWGHRLGRWKGDYAKEMEARGLDPWASWNPEMQQYCEQDVEVTHELFQRIEGKNYAPTAVSLERDSALLCAKIERNGFPFYEVEAATLYGKLVARRQELTEELVEAFGSWWESKGEFTPKRTINFKDPLRASMTAGCSYTKVDLVTFNPASRHHVAKRLKAIYGWVPQETTASGEPKVDEDVLSKLDYPHAKMLVEYFLLQKRIGQLAEGKQAWLKVVKNGKIHGSINPNGAVTGRATHSFPNVAQVPSVKAPYGEECRTLFGLHEAFLKSIGWTDGCMVGTDMSGLELRCLSHFMARWDGGAYGETVLNGDIHTANQEAAGLPTRDNAKTFIYAFLYGAGNEKLGSITGGGASRGKQLRRNFEAKVPAMGKLTEAVQTAVRQKGYLKGLDGRILHVRSPHSALNTLLQSAGALLCKKWMCLIEEELLACGLFHGWNGDFAFMAWVHDEVQIACRTREIAELVQELSPQCAKAAGDFFKFRCPLDADSKIGMNWAETH